MTDAERQAALRSFRELGNALVGLGRRLHIDRVVAIGRRIRVSPPEPAMLRGPVDELRSLVAGLGIGPIAAELRGVVAMLDAAIGFDN